MEHNLKICTECKYYFVDIQEDCHYCTHPKNKVTKTNLVTGQTSTRYKYTPENLRDLMDCGDDMCGNLGVWFQRKS